MSLRDWWNLAWVIALLGVSALNLVLAVLVALDIQRITGNVLQSAIVSAFISGSWVMAHLAKQHALKIVRPVANDRTEG